MTKIPIDGKYSQCSAKKALIGNRLDCGNKNNKYHPIPNRIGRGTARRVPTPTHKTTHKTPAATRQSVHAKIGRPYSMCRWNGHTSSLGYSAIATKNPGSLCQNVVPAKPGERRSCTTIKRNTRYTAAIAKNGKIFQIDIFCLNAQ